MTKTVLIDREVVKLAALLIQSQLGSPATVADLRASLESAQAGEPVAWQWRKKGDPWTLDKTFNTEVFATTANSEVRPLYAVHLTGAASQERNSDALDALDSLHRIACEHMQVAGLGEYEVIRAALQSTPPAARSAE